MVFTVDTFFGILLLRFVAPFRLCARIGAKFRLSILLFFFRFTNNPVPLVCIAAEF